MDITNLSNESDFKIVEHDLEELGKDDEGSVILKVKCQNGKEFTLYGYADYDDTFTYYSPFLDDLYAKIHETIEQFIAPQLKDIFRKEFDKNKLSSDDVFRKEKDGDIIFTFKKTPEDGRFGTTTYEIAAYDNDLKIGRVEGYLIPDAYYADNTFDLMDGITNGCLMIWEEIYGRKKEKILHRLQKYVEYNDPIVIDQLSINRAYRGRGIGTKLMQKFLKEYSSSTLALLCATNDEERGLEEKIFEEKLYSFYEKLKTDIG